MKVANRVLWACLAVIWAGAACNADLNIVNPNAADARRALSDPAALEAVAGGTLRTWFTGYEGMNAVGPLVTLADSYSSSWNNFFMLYINSQDPDGSRNTRPWKNDPGAQERVNLEQYWQQYYGAASSASDVLRAIRKDNLVINNASDTKRAETIAAFMLGASLSGISMNYDKGYIIDETVDVSALQYSNRKLMRDAAIAKLDAAIALANANTFTTPAAWTNGRAYSNTQIARIANTMAAMTLAYYPRDAAENATEVDWAKVAAYASKGMSTGTPFDFVFVGDGCNKWCHEVLVWFESIDTGVIHTRVANLLDPVTQKDPYCGSVGTATCAPGRSGNPQPNSPDKRLGDGTFGDASIVDGFGTIPVTATSNPGTDFAYTAYEIFSSSRGQYHQSNIGHIRYDLSRNQDPTGIYLGYGPAPVMSAGQNDLIWAEALIRGAAPNLAQAATLINNTRVTRGGLSPATAADGVAGLLTKLQYEQDVELLGLGATPFYNRRRLPNCVQTPGGPCVGGLRAGTPHEMPVPAKELGVKSEPLYTFGGATNPANSPKP
ncbi:MAG: hypothetical protein JWL61_959 [Gemmatimonadetes bacterium]|nr:hypothetical protein [Gemmatimonadota bacterium]